MKLSIIAVNRCDFVPSYIDCGNDRRVISPPLTESAETFRSGRTHYKHGFV